DLGSKFIIIYSKPMFNRVPETHLFTLKQYLICFSHKIYTHVSNHQVLTMAVR
ncbi:hypothetical protein ACJX0J_022150, partial [Zea mays]